MVPLRTLSKDILSIANRLGTAEPRRNDISERQVELWIHQYREWWINDRFNRKRQTYYEAKQALVQDLGCMLLQCVDQAECDALPVGCFVAKVIIPTPVEVEGCLDYVGSISKRKKFIECKNVNELEGKLSAPYGRNFLYYFRIGPTNLYVATSDSDTFFDLCYINVRGIFGDPTQACYKKSLTTSTCCYDPVNTNYPATGDMMEEVKMMILTKEFNISMHYIRDWKDTNRDDRQVQNFQPIH